MDERENTYLGHPPITYATFSSYAAPGESLAVAFGNGIDESSVYNPRLQLTNRQYSPISGGPYFNTTFVWTNANGQNNGNLCLQRNNKNTPAYDLTYTYDTMNRVLSSSQGDGTYAQAFSYDSFGNLTQTGSLTFDQGYDLNNRVLGWTYDAAGNLLLDQSVGCQIAYDAEAQGWLCGVTTPAGNNYQYIYDAEGHRVTTVSRTDANCAPLANGDYVLADYVNDQYGRQITKVNSSEQWQHVNVFANGELLATYEASDGGLHFALNDWLGDKRIQASPQGSTQYAIDLTCWNLPFNSHFGCSSNTNGTDATEHHYTGREHDPYTGLDLFGARDYANYSGRFLSPDDPDNDRHWGDPQSLNLYSYGRNNPLKNIDPDGETCQTNSTGGDVYDDGDGQGCSQLDTTTVSATVTAQPGNVATSLALNGLMALSNMAGDYFAGLTGLRAYPNDQLSRDWTGTASNIGVKVAGLMVGPEGEAGEAINITERGLQHVMARHAAGGLKSAGKSLFNAGTDIKALVKAAESKAPETLPNGDLRFTVDAGQMVGVDRATGQATSKYTVVTDSSRNLITAHPGSYN